MTARPSLVLIPQYFGALLFDRRTSRYLPFDQAAARALDALIDSPDGAGDDDGAFRVMLAERGFLRLDGRLAAARITRPAPRDQLLGPLAVHVEVVGACNLTCTHCFAGELPRNHDALTLHDLDGLFAQLASLGSFRLGLTGGEPLLRKDLFDVVDAALAHGLHPCLTTNALLIDEHSARELGRRELVWLNVSLEGARASTNDAVRGAGVFDRVLEKLALLGRHARFTLAFTLMEHNVDEVEACVALARSVGAHTAVFRPLYPVGIAARQSPSLMPSYRQYVDALARLDQLDDCAADVFAYDAFSPSAREELRGVVMPNAGCGAANTVASVSVQGNVSPCSFLGPAFEDGNIRVRSFEDIWRDGRIFRRLRAHDPAHDRFSGGCRARAQAFAGSAFAPDPWQLEHDGQSPAQAKPVRALPILQSHDDDGGACPA